MLMTPDKRQAAARAAQPPIEQIYLTHCLHNEGLYQQAGFTIRASSTADPLLVRFALEYPSYEAPAGVLNGKRPAEAAPRRLALVRIPGGRSALIHSIHLPEEERGRANNFFSHILIAPGLSARDALATWGSPQWRSGCSQEISTKLPPLDGLPESDLLNDRAVTAFLQPVVVRRGDSLNTFSCPERLANDLQRRRELVILALRGCLFALQAGPAAARARFYLLAEPGLTALLLYATARMLPDALATNLTFSTYENAHRDLRTYRHARVIGTYLRDPTRGLDAEFFTTRGCALDTFQHKFSPELRADSEPAIEEWIDLAARGDWGTIDKVHRLLGKTSTSVMAFREGVQAAKISLRLASAQASPADLVALKHASWGPAILDEHRDKIWPLVRQASLSDERVRAEFADMLRERVGDLEQQTATALAAQPPGDWQPSWRLLCEVLKDDSARLREALQRILPQPPYWPGLRLALLRELRRGELSPVDPRLPWHGLLRQCSADEMDHFAHSDLPREWFVWVLVYALSRSETRAEGVRHLHAGDDSLLKAFWVQFRLLKDETQRLGLLAPLFPRDEPEGVRFLERLLILRPHLRAETLDRILSSFDAFSHAGAEFWGRDNHLGLLVDFLRDLNGESGTMWDRLCSLINRDVLPPGDAYQNIVLMELAAAKDRPGPAMPQKTAQIIDDWILLRDHFEKASGVAESGRRAVIDACNRLGFDSIDVLTRYFVRFIMPQGINDAVLADFVRFFHSFFLAGMDFQTYSSRLIAWLQIVAACPDETQRATFQRYYLEKQVPFEFRYRLAEETHTAGRLLPAVLQELQHLQLQGAIAEQSPASEPVRSEPIDELFQLSGVRCHEPPPSLFASVGRRLPWLLCTLTGGMLAAYLSQIYKVQLQRVAAMVLFIPLILALAESMVIQSVSLTVRALRDQTFTGAVLARRLGKEMLAGLLLGLVCGLLVGIVAGLWTRSLPLALGLGGALAGGLAGAAGVGCAVPSVLRLLRWDSRLAAGPAARTIADLLTLLIYFGLACLLIR